MVHIKQTSGIFNKIVNCCWLCFKYSVKPSVDYSIFPHTKLSMHFSIPDATCLRSQGIKPMAAVKRGKQAMNRSTVHQRPKHRKKKQNKKTHSDTFTVPGFSSAGDGWWKNDQQRTYRPGLQTSWSCWPICNGYWTTVDAFPWQMCAKKLCWCPANVQKNNFKIAVLPLNLRRKLKK